MELTPHEKVDSEASMLHLDRLFVYQNNVTGQVSSTPLTLRQLCRILCPSGTFSNYTAAPTIRHLTADTNLLRLELDGTYGPEGWQPAHSIPVLQEVLCWWYYYSTASSSTEEVGAVGPPVSVRTLSAVVRSASEEMFQVSSVRTDSTWRSLLDLPDLQLAMQAFEDIAESIATSEVSNPTIGTTSVVTQFDNASADIQLELEAFLNATDTSSSQKRKHENFDVHADDEESYDSDGGTRYIKDNQTGNWVHEALVAVSSSSLIKRNLPVVPLKVEPNSADSNSETLKKHPRKKAKFAAKNSRCWIYVTGLPSDVSETEIAERFAKAGLLDLEPKTQLPKIKLYRHKHDSDDVVPHSRIGQPKGDASICYARPESVSLAVTLFDGAPFRISTTGFDSKKLMTVQAAKFEQHGSEFDSERTRSMVSNAQRKIAKLATKQAVDWDEGEYNGRLTGGRKGLRIIVLKHSFDPSLVLRLSSEKTQDEFFGTLEEELRAECEQFGVVEKITFFASNPEGVTIVKFTQPGAASDAVFRFNGSSWKGRSIQAIFWDGVTDYTVRDETKEAVDTAIREEEFGNWLESQDLPDELRLKTE